MVDGMHGMARRKLPPTRTPNDFDVHSSEADAELLAALEQHVRENEAFYLGLDKTQP